MEGREEAQQVLVVMAIKCSYILDGFRCSLRDLQLSAGDWKEYA